MSLFFNLKVFEDLACKEPTRAVRLLRKVYEGSLATNDKDHKYIRLLKSGNSYISNPRDLFNNINRYDVIHLIQYICLAGRRDYFLFKQYGSARLQLEYYPDINITEIENNPLLKISNNQLIFKYEQDTYGTRF